MVESVEIQSVFSDMFVCLCFCTVYMHCIYCIYCILCLLSAQLIMVLMCKVPT